MPSVTSLLPSQCGCERSLSHWNWGVAGLISPLSCLALHLLTCRMTPADLSLAQTPSITPPDAHPHSRGAPEVENLTNDSLVIWLDGDSEFRESIQDNKNCHVLSWSTTRLNHEMPIRHHKKMMSQLPISAKKKGRSPCRALERYIDSGWFWFGDTQRTSQEGWYQDISRFAF